MVSGDSSSPTLTGADDEIVHEVTGLQDCTSYSFTVTATGDGMLFSNRPDDATSATKDETTECLNSPPAPVLRVSAGRTSITVSWHGEQGVTYVVSGDSSSPTLTGAGRDIDHEVTGLQECTDYSFTVTATGDGRLYTNRDGTETSDTEDGRTLPCTAPAPTDLRADSSDQTRVTVSWDSRGGIAAYKLEHALAGTPTPTWATSNDNISPNADPNARTSGTADMLVCGTAYLFRVSGKGTGWPYLSSFGDTSEPEEASTEVCRRPPMPTGLVATPTAQDAITVSWDTDPNVARYRLEYAATPTPTFTVVEVAPAALAPTPTPTPTTHTVSGLQLCNTDYRFRVSGMGYGSPYSTDYGETAEVTSSIPCPAPTPANVIATPIAQDMIKVSWDTQEGVTAYRVQYASVVAAGTPAPTWTTANDNVAPTATATSPSTTARTSFTVDSLICGTTYRFKVSGKGDGMAHSGITYSSFSFGAASDPSDTSAAAATDFFCTPQNLNVTPLAQRRARLSWEPVDNAERYFVQVRQGNLGGWSPFTDFAPSPTPSVPIELDNIMTVGGSDVGLAHASAYQFQVRARVGGGHVTAMAFSTPVAIVDSPIKSINGDSSGVSGSNGKMVVKLEWAANRQYTIRYRKLPDNHHQIPYHGHGWLATNVRRE